MVTKVSAFEEPKEIYGLSTDTKPTDVPNGSIFVEMDTSKLYVFDGDSLIWIEWAA
jgi:hypothetical protein